MGHSIFTPFENENDKNIMREFLEQNFRNLDYIVGDTNNNNHTNSHTPHDDLNYTGGNTEPFLGYNHSTSVSDIEIEYRYAICYWIAVHGGKRVNNRPVFVYDGVVDSTIYVNEEPEDKEYNHVVVNEFGYRKMPSLVLTETYTKEQAEKHKAVIKALETIDQAVYNELKRLHELWKMKESENLDETN